MATSFLDVSFQGALKRMVDSLSPAEKEDFQFTTLEDVHLEIAKIQEAQGSERRLRNLPRIKGFLEAMEQFGKVVEVFLNVSDVVAFVWGPVKLLLQIASTWADSLDTLLNAYEEINENIPQLLKYQQLFADHPYMRKVLELMYGDILEFHRQALKFFKRPAWKQLFRSSWKTFDTKYQVILSNLSRHKTLVESQASLVDYEQSKLARLATQNGFERIAKGEQSQRLIAVIEKIHPPNTISDHEQAVEVRQEHPGTGRWILEVGRLKKWMDPSTTDVPLLWVNGIPGAGKTVIASLIIEELKMNCSVTVTFFYCKYNDHQKNSLIAVLRSILVQIIQQNEDLVSFVYDKCTSNSEVSLESPALLKELVETCIKSCSNVLIVIDGLDECSVGEEKRIATWVLTMIHKINKDSPGSLRGLLISQRDATLERLLTRASVLSLDTQDHQKDIEAYCLGWSPRIKEKFDMKTDSANRIVTSVATQAEGLFLFAKLVMTNLFEQTSRRRLFAELEPDCFPNGLEAAYERIVHRVLDNSIESEREDAQRILSWVVCARRPLKWHEFQGGVFSIDNDSQTIDFEDRRLRVTSRDLCGSLIDIRPGDTIELVHRSAKSYLITTGRVSPSSESLRIAEFCLRYLNFRCFDADLTVQEVQDFFQKAYYSFEDYAIGHWIDHLSSCMPEALPEDSQIHQRLAGQVEILLNKHGLGSPQGSLTQDSEQLRSLKHWDPSQRLMNIAYLIRQKKSTDSCLDLEAQLRRRRTIHEELVANLDPDSDTARLVVSFNGRSSFKCPKIYCEWFHDGFDDEGHRKKHINQHDRPFRCTFEECLHSELGYETEKELKKHLKKTHPTDGNAHRTFPTLPRRKKGPDIFSAAEAGDLETVKRCVEKLGISAKYGTDDTTGETYAGGDTPLFVAAMHNQVEVASYLLQKSADPDYRLDRGDTALRIAVRFSHIRMANVLLLWQDVNTRHAQTTGSNGTIALRDVSVLHEAVTNEDLPMVQLLVDNGFLVSAADSGGKSPLFYAAQSANGPILECMLRSDDGDWDRNSRGETMLYSAVSTGRRLVGADTENAYRSMQSAMPIYADVDGDNEIVKLLSEYGVLEARDNEGRTALHWAGIGGDEVMTRVLLNQEFDIEDTDHNGETILHLVCRGQRRLQLRPAPRSDNYYAVAQMLFFNNQACANSRNNAGETPLHVAAQNGHSKIIQLLLNHGADLKAEDKSGKTALDHGILNNYDAVTGILSPRP